MRIFPFGNGERQRKYSEENPAPFSEVLEYTEQVADALGTQVVVVDDLDLIDGEDPRFKEKFVIDSHERIWIPNTIDGKEW